MVRAADAAEARGDAQAVLNLIEQDVRSRGDFTFWRPWRLDRLVQVVAIGSDLPGWAVSRWLLAQASHQLDGSARDRTSEALEIALESRGGLRTVDGTDELDAKCKVMDHDWVFRQVLLYELGGAESFVDRVASPELVERSDRFDHWLGTAMGGYRLVRESPRESIWADLGNGHEVASINLGSSCLRRTGECVIGRVVPAGSGSMFEALPLPVPEDVADRVARKPDEWLSAIAPHRWIHRDWHEYGLLTDVPIGVQLLVAASCTGAIGQDMGTAEEALGRLVTFVRAALDDNLLHEDANTSPYPSVAAALERPYVLEEVGSGLRPGDVSKLHRLAELLPPPADVLCRRLARDLEEAA